MKDAPPPAPSLSFWAWCTIPVMIQYGLLVPPGTEDPNCHKPLGLCDGGWGSTVEEPTPHGLVSQDAFSPATPPLGIPLQSASQAPTSRFGATGRVNTKAGGDQVHAAGALAKGMTAQTCSRHLSQATQAK